jgi:hypothetical protein
MRSTVGSSSTDVALTYPVMTKLSHVKNDVSSNFILREFEKKIHHVQKKRTEQKIVARYLIIHTVVGSMSR